MFLLYSLHSLQQEQQRWQVYVDDHSNTEWLLSNCVVTAAFLIYCGGMTTDCRRRLADFFNHMSEHHGLPVPKKRMFRDIPLMDFLYTPVSAPPASKYRWIKMRKEWGKVLNPWELQTYYYYHVHKYGSWWWCWQNYCLPGIRYFYCGPSIICTWG